MIGLLMLLSACGSPKPTKWVECSIASHNITSDQYGNISYNTAVFCKDGKYYNVEGINPFHDSIGTKHNYSEDYLSGH